MYALVDCNNFYASCERAFCPQANGMPVVVLSNNDGCVIARSNEAKAIGIPMGAPAFKFQELFAQHKVFVYSANFVLYGDMSHRVMSMLHTYCPDIEKYSIDEAFMDFTGFDTDLHQLGVEMHHKVLRCTSIPISVGFAPTKALAKVANRIAKKYADKLDNSYVIDTEEKRIKALKWLKIEDVWGIGRQLSKRLDKIGVKTAYEFTQLDDAWVRTNLSIVELRLKNELSGQSVLVLDTPSAKKSIATTRSFEKNYTTLDELKERVATFSVSCAEKLRNQKSKCQSLMVFIHTNGFKKELPQYSRNIVVKLPFATSSSIDIAKYAIEGLTKIFKQGYAYKKAGVVIMDFIPEHIEQIHLFDNPNPKHKSLMITMDKLNKSFGCPKVKLANQDQNRTWKMRQERLSKRYTTNWSELLEVN